MQTVILPPAQVTLVQPVHLAFSRQNSMKKV